jgi:SAM-dependent methyltransferase
MSGISRLESPLIALDIEQSRAWGQLGHGKVAFVQAASDCMPFRRGSMDVVVCKDLLHHCSFPKETIKECLRVASKAVVIVEANASNPIMRMHEEYHNEHHMSRSELKVLVSEAAGRGFSIDDHRVTSYPFYFPVAFRDWKCLIFFVANSFMVFLFKILKSKMAAQACYHLLRNLTREASFNICVVRPSVENQVSQP